jgi:hypothetical protein
MKALEEKSETRKAKMSQIREIIMRQRAWQLKETDGQPKEN